MCVPDDTRTLHVDRIARARITRHEVTLIREGHVRQDGIIWVIDVTEVRHIDVLVEEERIRARLVLLVHERVVPHDCPRVATHGVSGERETREEHKGRSVSVV